MVSLLQSSRLRWGWTGFLIASLLLVMLLPSAGHINRAAARPNVQITTTVIDGVVQSINDGTWVVGGVTILVNATTAITGYPVVGSTVHIVAVTVDGQLVAQTVALLVTPTVSPTPDTRATPTATITSGGPTVTHTVTASVSPTPIALTGTLTGTPIPYITIIIDGPVEAIIVDVIIIYGEHIKLKHDDMLRLKIKLGDWVRVQGHFDRDTDDSIIIVAIVIIIIEQPPAIVIIPSGGGDGGDDDGGKHKKHDDN